MTKTMLIAGLVLSAPALAHPGHGWMHLVSEPDHVAALLAPLVVAIAWLIWRRARRLTKRKD
jgi:hypothetical protein